MISRTVPLYVVGRYSANNEKATAAPPIPNPTRARTRASEMGPVALALMSPMVKVVAVEARIVLRRPNLPSAIAVNRGHRRLSAQMTAQSSQFAVQM